MINPEQNPVNKKSDILNNGYICTSLPPGLYIDGKSLYEIAAEDTGVKIDVRNVGSSKENKPIFFIEFPEGGFNQVLNKTYELAGGVDKFYEKFGVVKKREEAPEPPPPCPTGEQAKSNIVFEWIKGLVNPKA